VVEHQGQGQIIFCKYADFFRIIGCLWRSRCPGQEDGGDGMVARISCGMRVGVQLPYEFNLKFRFFPRFTDGRFFQ